MGKTIDQAFLDASEVKAEDFIRKNEFDMTDDLELFVNLLQKENLFTFTKGREYKAFPQFKYNFKCGNPNQFRKNITRLSKRLDKIRQVTMGD